MGYATTYANLYSFSGSGYVRNRVRAPRLHGVNATTVDSDPYREALRRVELVERKALIHSQARRAEREDLMRDREGFKTLLSMILPAIFLALSVAAAVLLSIFIAEGLAIYAIPSGFALLVFGLLAFTSISVRKSIKAEWANSTKS